MVQSAALTEQRSLVRAQYVPLSFHIDIFLFFLITNFPTFTLSNLKMKAYQVTISFEWNDEFAALIPAHRTYINMLINKNIIDQYVVSMESQRVWVTLNAETKAEVEKILKKSPLHKYWTYEIDELFVLDGQLYRLPAVTPN